MSRETRRVVLNRVDTNMKIRPQKGFTLVEMAIVLALIGLILGTGLTILSAQQDQRRIEETGDSLDEAREALIGYALSSIATTDFHPYLPCPDKTTAAGAGTANDGEEDRTTTVPYPCVTQEGNLPWVTLGMTPPTDSWSNRLRYRVTANFSNRTDGMELTSAGDINVRDDASVNTIATSVPAIILSHGKNGLGAINTACNPISCSPNPAPPASNIDELANTDNTVNFVSHSPTPAGALSQSGAAVGYFDDQVIWLSQYTLFNRMVQAGRLP